MPHRAVVRLVLRSGLRAACRRRTSFLQLAPLAFDASTFEIWGALLNGAQLVGVPAARAHAGRAGAGHRARGVTHAVAHRRPVPPDGGRQPGRRCVRVRQLLAGGDVLSPRARAARAGAAAAAAASSTATAPRRTRRSPRCYPVEHAGALGTRCPSAGPSTARACTSSTRRCSPCPLGVPGELFAGGDGLAHGLPEPAGADGGAVHPGSLQHGAGRAAVPHRRPGPLPRATAPWSSWAASTSR